MSKSKIEWTNRTWNPVTGCTKVSQGCKNCYAERMYERFNGKGSFKNVQTHEDRLNHPATWKKPQMVFVNSMSDLFHEDVPFSFIDLVFASMAINNKHTYQILTKRPQRMLEWFNYKCTDWKNENMQGDGRIRFQTYHYFGNELAADKWQWPIPNVWIGVSVEDQKAADIRIPLLLQTPAAVRFLSCEPLLGPVDISKYMVPAGVHHHPDNKLNGDTGKALNAMINYINPDLAKYLHWVIAGGESGPGARPMHPDWVVSLCNQCDSACVPFFFKQWGEYLPYERTVQAPFWRNCATREEHDGHAMNFIDAETGEPGKFNGHRWYDMMDAIALNDENKNSDCNFLKVGKHNAGRMLDGKEYSEYPKQK